MLHLLYILEYINSVYILLKIISIACMEKNFFNNAKKFPQNIGGKLKGLKIETF